MGDVVEASFRLLDIIPFTVRQDMARLINLYMHDPVGYMDKRSALFPRMSPVGPTGPTGPSEPLSSDPSSPAPLSP